MDTNTHTPGPWEVVHGRLVRAPEGDDVVCKVVSDIGAADAQLIAAAPDLLAACELMLAEHAKYMHLHDSEATMLAAAIAKALGSEVQG